MSAMQTTTGQLTYRRAVSKRLVFYDLLCTGPGGEQTWYEVVVKEGIFGTVQQVKDLRDNLKLGDEVSVQGHFRGQHELQATAVAVQHAWRDSHPGVTFCPQPSPLHASRPPALQQPAQQQRQPREAAVASDGGGNAGSKPDLLCPAGTAAVQSAPADGAAVEVQPAAAIAAVLAQPPTTSAAGAAAVAGVAQRPRLAVCKYWVNTGRCSKGAACPHAHLQTGALQRQWLQQMRSERQLLSSTVGFSHSSSAAAKSRRAQVLAAWLLQKFGREALNAGAGVLDVAGGAGGMTFELSFVHGIKCTLVDPRLLKLSKPQHRRLQEAGRTAVIHTLTTEQLQERQVQELHTCSLETSPGPCSPPDPVHFQGIQGLFGPQLWRSEGWRRRFGGSCGAFSLVLGLHPDQATEPILDYALETGSPFAIVPCCVFPRLFPERRILQPGSSKAVPVLTYPDLVEYLVSKGQGQKEVLQFEGANTVVWSFGERKAA